MHRSTPATDSSGVYCHPRAKRLERARLRLGPIPDGHVVAAPKQVFDHAAAEQAGSEKCDVRHPRYFSRRRSTSKPASPRSPGNVFQRRRRATIRRRSRQIAGPAIGTHHHPLPARKASMPHPATAVNRRGPKSRAGLDRASGIESERQRRSAPRAARRRRVPGRRVRAS